MMAVFVNVVSVKMPFVKMVFMEMMTVNLAMPYEARMQRVVVNLPSHQDGHRRLCRQSGVEVSVT